ncbi:helix-turn-helix domain-containing protein [Actinomadura sp. 21ATH]|uniref:helix-turn-helix domain-containing protein n=1 Tax=Actinomadura sp. 21ATH TaxID=1735444 RepID=UPI0035BFD72F
MTAKKEPVSKEQAGRWLREQRRRRGYETAGAFARALGVDTSRVTVYERGQARVPDDRADDIAELLQLDIIYVRRSLGLWTPPEGSHSVRPSPAESLAAAEAERDRWVEEMRRNPELARSFANLVAYAVTSLSVDGPVEQDSNDETSEPEGSPNSDSTSDLIADRNKTG